MEATLTVANPPVIEVVVGCQFTGQKLSAGEIFNAYLSDFRSDFPDMTEAPPLPDFPLEEGSFPVLTNLESRKQFSNASTGRMLQLQNNKLYLNWRRLRGAQDYPRFSTIYDEFRKYFQRLKAMRTIAADYYELTYVDQFDQRLIYEHGLAILTVPQNSMAWNFSMRRSLPKLGGDLASQISTAKEKPDGSPVVRAHTTIRGYSPMQMDDWFIAAHAEHTAYFKSLLTPSLSIALGLQEG